MERNRVQRILSAAWPRVIAIGILLGIWQLLVVVGVQSPGGEPLPGPGDTIGEIGYLAHIGVLFPALFQTLERAAVGYILALALGTLIGLAVVRVPVLRAGIGSLLAGLQSLPSVVWVPVAAVFLAIGGQVEYAVYFVVIMGAFPSIAMGLMSAYDNIPPLTLSLARSMGARGPGYYRHFIFSAVLPGYVAGMKQAWAFSWRSLMAAELIIGSTANAGLGQILDNGRSLTDLSEILAAMLMILVVGMAVNDLIFAPMERGLLRRRGLAPAALFRGGF
jgi:NitT/TauT family transport system permease protein